MLRDTADMRCDEIIADKFMWRPRSAIKSTLPSHETTPESITSSSTIRIRGGSIVSIISLSSSACFIQVVLTGAFVVSVCLNRCSITRSKWSSHASFTSVHRSIISLISALFMCETVTRPLYFGLTLNSLKSPFRLAEPDMMYVWSCSLTSRSRSRCLI